MRNRSNVLALGPVQDSITCLQKPIHHSLSLPPVSLWYDPAWLLEINHVGFVQLRLRIGQLMEVKRYDSPH